MQNDKRGIKQRKILNRYMEQEQNHGASEKMKKEQGAKNNKKGALEKVQKEQGAKQLNEWGAGGTL